MFLTDNALAVLKKRYFRKDGTGTMLEDWPTLLRRVAENIADSDPEKTERYVRLMDSGAFLPNSPTLMNAGNDLQQLSACFVLPIDDSLVSIFDTIKNAALIHKSGGGTGFSFSRLREANSRVRTTNGVSSGPISFLKVFNAATDAVKQGGTRRGANMAILNVDHPQILEFITCKEDTSELTNFNISVGITEEFMQAVLHDDEYDLVSPRSNQVVRRLKARDVFTLIVEMAHKNGEPGVVFIDRINQHNPTPQLGRIESTNPCGEQPLLPNEACNLGSINLLTFCTPDGLDFDTLRQAVSDAVDFLDDVIDRSRFPLPEIDEMVKGNRKIGLGVMGWADVLYTLGIPYNSEQAVELAEEVMEFIDFHAKQRSVDLAEIKGVFPNYKGSIYDQGILLREGGRLDWASLLSRIRHSGIRNAAVTTIAPTGTISMIANTSSGIEPQFSLVYVKTVMDGEKLVYANPVFERALQNACLYSKALMERISEAGSLAHIDEIPDSLRSVFVTAHDITPEWHIRMQAAFQKFTDNAVSKTINFAREATREDIRIAFELAYDLGCKGVTVYRDGSRENQVLTVGAGSGQEPEKSRVAPRERPEVTHGFTQKIETGCGHLYITVNSDDHGACEVFIQMGKVGGCASAQLEAIARTVSLCLRSNVRVESLIRQFKGIRCPQPMWYKGGLISSCADGVAYALETYLNNHGNATVSSIQVAPAPHSGEAGEGKSNRLCPDCGSSIEFTEGCMKCPICGWSKC
jgi:ribonucleoside-diphosphate reductase alpha chain